VSDQLAETLPDLDPSAQSTQLASLLMRAASSLVFRRDRSSARKVT
jgi:hypothetical protein